MVFQKDSNKGPILPSILDQCARAAVALFFVLIAVVFLGVGFYVFRPGLTPISPNSDFLQVAHFDGQLVQNNESEISKRPLFWASRRPVIVDDEVVVEVAKSTPRNKALDEATLLGVMGSGNDASVLIVIDKTQHRVRVNEILVGWKLQKILPTGAVFVPNVQDDVNFEPKTVMLHKRVPLPSEWQGSHVLK